MAVGVTVPVNYLGQTGIPQSKTNAIVCKLPVVYHLGPIAI